MEKTTRDSNGETGLHTVALCGNTKACALLLKQGASPTSRNKNGWTPLHYAAFWGRLQVCQLLVQHGAELEAQGSDDGWTALHCAAFWGHVEICRVLVQAGACVVRLNRNGNTPKQLTSNEQVKDLLDQTLKAEALRQAAANGDADTCRLLLESEVPVDMADPTKRWTALHFAASCGHLEICRLLVQHGASVQAVTDENETALQLAKSHAEVEHFLEECMDSFEWFLDCVIHKDRLDLVSRLCDKYLHARTATGQTAMHLAASTNRLAVLKTLVFRGANLNDRDDHGATALHAAVCNDCLEVVRFLVAHGAHMDFLDGEGYAPVHLAVVKGHTKVVHELVASGASLQQTSEDGSNVFHLASVSNECEMMEFLFDQAPDLVRQCNKQGWTPLHCAAWHGASQTTLQLLTRARKTPGHDRMDINARTNRNATALHCAVQALLANATLLDLKHERSAQEMAEKLAAAEANSVSIVQQLLDAGIGLDLRDGNGETALLMASRDNKEVIVRVLLEHGARVDVASNTGNTAVTVAATESIRSVLEVYQSSQHYRDRSIALLMDSRQQVTLSELRDLVPLITSVYDLRSFRLLAQMTDAQDVHWFPALECAFQHILDKKLVLDDEACVFFKLVLQDCLEKKVFSIKDQMLWDRRAEKVNTESAGWVLELKRQVYENTMRLDAHDESLHRVIHGMQQLHITVMENREAIKSVVSRVSSLQAQVNEGKRLMRCIVEQGRNLSSQVHQLQDRVIQGEQNLLTVATSLHDFRTCYVRQLEQEKQNETTKKVMGVVASVCGFVFAPLLKEVFNSLVDFANPLEILSLSYQQEDIISFLSDQTRDKLLEPAVEMVLEKAMIKPEEFETALRGEIVLRHFELIGDDTQRSHSLQLEYADPAEIQQLQLSLPAIESGLENALKELRALSAHPTLSTTSNLVSRITSDNRTAERSWQPHTPTLALPSEPQRLVTNANEVSSAKARTRTATLPNGADCVEFIDDIGAFPYHDAVRKSGGKLDDFCALLDAIQGNEPNDPNVEMRMQFITKSTSEEMVNAAEYAYLLGFREVGDLLAAQLSHACVMPSDSTWTSVELMGSVEEHPYFYCVYETSGHLNECKELLELAIEEDSEPIDLRVPVRVIRQETRAATWTAVEYASHLGYMDIVKYLLKTVGVKSEVSAIVLLRRTQQQARQQQAVCINEGTV